MNRTMLRFFSLKFSPFDPDIPVDALYVPAAVDAFCRRVEISLLDGGFALVTGEPGCGKSAALRLFAHRLSSQPDVVVSTMDHPQSKPIDFCREVGDRFGLQLSMSNRGGGFKALHAKWADHIATCHHRPILIIDEAQQMIDTVFGPHSPNGP